MAAALALSLIGCSPLPTLEGRSVTRALEDTAHTLLGQAIDPPAHSHPGQSGFVELDEGHEAFATRMLLAQAAQRSLDVQYYIWHADLTGTLLMQALLQAAERGVRVRLLLDDNNTPGLDASLAAMNSHPNLEVRLFNPFMQRNARWFGYLSDFGRLNRRMHNKTFTADNRVTIVGGRNIGDEYFDAGQEMAFVDMDVLAIGVVVPRVSEDFDRYWASASAYPLEKVLAPARDQDTELVSTRAAQMRARPEAARYLLALARSDFVRRMIAGELTWEWTDIRLVSDDPAKGLGLAAKDAMMPWQLAEVLGLPTQELLLVSPYFVPTARGTDALTALASRGVVVRVLTNSLAATDVPAVHAGYAKHRRALLGGGVQLYEMKPDGYGARSSPNDRGLFGSSGASLHAKTFSVDARRVFIGSFNLDPRSAALNTELGFVIDSPRLAAEISARFKDTLPRHSYRLRLEPDGHVVWHDLHAPDGAPPLYRSEPQSSLWVRAMVRVLSWLPIDWML